MADKYAVQKNKEFADINDIDTDLPDEKEEDTDIGGFEYAKLTEAQKKHVWDCFKHFDKDGNDRLDKKELISAMRAVGLLPTKKDIDQIMKQVDENENGYIEFDEFKQLIARSWRSAKENRLELVAAFRIFDINKDGFISRDELSKVMTSFGEKMSEEEAQQYIDLVDTTTSKDGTKFKKDGEKDGKLNYEEFAKWIAGATEF